MVITIDHDRLVERHRHGNVPATGTPVSARTAQEYACDAKVSWYTPGNRRHRRERHRRKRLWRERRLAANGSGGGSPDEKGADQGRGRRGPALSDPTRLYTGKTRRLLELRDRGCAFPGCDRPPAWTHAHHIIAWSRGGPTTVDNGVLLCGHHHRLIHQGHWTVTIAARRPTRIHPPRVDRPASQATPQPPTPNLNHR